MAENGGNGSNKMLLQIAFSIIAALWILVTSGVGYELVSMNAKLDALPALAISVQNLKEAESEDNKDRAHLWEFELQTRKSADAALQRWDDEDRAHNRYYRKQIDSLKLETKALKAARSRTEQHQRNEVAVMKDEVEKQAGKAAAAEIRLPRTIYIGGFRGC